MSKRNLYYSLDKILSRNKVFNFVIGQRGGGKSFNAKVWCVNQFLKTGKLFIWIRRYKTELNYMPTFFDDLKAAGYFPDHKLEVKGRRFYVDGKVAGEYAALTQAQILKSSAFPEVDKIIFDEFIPENGYRYISADEPTQFLGICESIFRDRERTKVLFLANNISLTNPYFEEFGMIANPDKVFVTGKHAVIEYYKNPEFAEHKKATPFGSAISDLRFGKYAIDNEVLNDDDTFVMKRSKNCSYVITLRFNGTKYGFWVDYDNQCLVMSNKIDPDYLTISITDKDHNIDSFLAKEYKKHPKVRFIKESYNSGKLFFETPHIKSKFFDLYKYIR